MKESVLVSIGLFAVFACAAASQADYKLITLATFNGTNGNGPLAGLVADASGNLYGTTPAGGAGGNGTLFELAAGTHAFSTLATFDYLTNGSSPDGRLVADASGNLYGTTQGGGTLNGGAIGYGTVFELAADTHALSTLATFDYLTNGSSPDGRLVADASGNLYGTTNRGGDLTLSAGSGSVVSFSCTTNSNRIERYQ